MFRKQVTSLHPIMTQVCLGVAILCLGTAYVLAGYWWILPFFLGMVVLWIYLKKRSVFWSSSSILFACVLLAAIGITINLSFLLMILSFTASVAYWDLANFRQSIPGSLLSPQELSLEKHHLRSLAMAMIAGLIFVSLGFLIDLHISFFITIMLVLAAVGCLTYGLWYILQEQ